MLASANRKLFTGHEYESNTGLYYAKARYYDPDQGRFLTQDAYLGEPGAPPSLHRYAYAASNPTRYVDPTGHVYVTEDGEAIRSPEEALLPADALQWSKADFEMADSETRYFCTRVDGYRSCGIWTPGSDGGRAETAESRTGESTVVLRAPSELKSSRTLLQEELARAYRTRVRSRRAERSEAYWHGTADSVLGIGKVLSDWGVLFANVFAPEWEDEEGTLRRTTDHGVWWNSLDSVREGSSRWSSWWEQTVMFGRPSAPLLALSYDEGALGADVALAVAPFGGTGAVRSLGTVATGRVSTTVARTSRAMLVGGRATRGPPLPNAALRPGVVLEDAWAGSVGAARARSVLVQRPASTPRTILGTEVGAPVRAQLDAPVRALGITNVDAIVEWFHGSLDVQALREGGFRTVNRYGDPIEPPFVCVTTDCRAAWNAIDPRARYDAQFTDPEKLGIVTGRMTRAEWEALHRAGHLRTNPYKGFDHSLVSSETKAVTPEGVEALNRSMKK